MKGSAHLLQKLATAAVNARIMTRTDMSWMRSNFQGYNTGVCVCVCKCISEQLTYSNNMRHPVRVLNPNETYNQWCPVFPNRTPGRQPSISHGCKVAGSTFFFQNSKDDSELLIKTEFDGAYVDFGVCVKFAIIVLGATFSCCCCLFVFCFLFLLLTSLRAARSGWSTPVPHRRIGDTPANAGCYN